jgi:hypothetical protein
MRLLLGLSLFVCSTACSSDGGQSGTDQFDVETGDEATSDDGDNPANGVGDAAEAGAGSSGAAAGTREADDGSNGNAGSDDAAAGDRDAAPDDDGVATPDDVTADDAITDDQAPDDGAAMTPARADGGGATASDDDGVGASGGDDAGAPEPQSGADSGGDPDGTSSSDSGSVSPAGDTTFRLALGPGCGLGRLPVSSTLSDCNAIASLGCPGEPPPDARMVVNIASVRLDDGSAICDDILDETCGMPYSSTCSDSEGGGTTWLDGSRIQRTITLHADGATVVFSPAFVDGPDLTEGDDVVLELGPCCREIVDVRVPVTDAVSRFVVDTQWALEDELGEMLPFGGLNQLEFCPDELPEAGQLCPSQFGYQCRYPFDNPSPGCTGEVETYCSFVTDREWSAAGEVCEDVQ